MIFLSIWSSFQHHFMKFLITCVHAFAEFVYFSSMWIKLYRILCFTKLTFDQLPLFNPYDWPLSFIRVLTVPYFRFWSRLLPRMKLGGVRFDVSRMVALESLNILFEYSWELRFISLLLLERLVLFLETLKSS
jgi:hypothetical protein